MNSQLFSGGAFSGGSRSASMGTSSLESRSSGGLESRRPSAPPTREQAVSGLVVIVEDEADIASALEYNFEREGFQTRKAATGRAALDLLGRDPLPDLVILDLMLPDISGTEVCRHIRMSDRTRHVPVMMLTAKAEEIDRVVGFEVGA